MFRPVLLSLSLLLAPALPALADDGFARIDDKAKFRGTGQGRELRYGAFGIRLQVEPDGQIRGRALGWAITGKWDWKDGYFCREMDWSGMEIDYNCQLVEAQGAEKLRFTVDQGAGDSAVFRLR